MSFRDWLRQRYWQRIRKRPFALPTAVFQQSALVFAPHEDDETLGCGGMILQKRAAGANVGVVFMTDGRQSHAHLMPVEELIAHRRQEALDACRVLGVAEDHVSFLDFTDGYLSEAVETAVSPVLDLLQQYQPAEVFIPYIKEPPADHVATNLIVMAALKQYSQPVTVYEYPVWFWYHWPWVSLDLHHQGERKAIVKNTLSTFLGWRLFTDFNCSLDISPVLAQKCLALEQHKTQMFSLMPDKGWLTLHDVAGGDWLACFFQEKEIYRRFQSLGSS
ncbi:MAG: PIG-L family deacetylase [Ardenticatenaceae bacterium]|nr:PIG-L family deacetylase [Ardenticatenaceae bacterium]MCB8988674.1 PIG-L family deacetylase [Ardenticatenaceae bacterium]